MDLGSIVLAELRAWVMVGGMDRLVDLGAVAAELMRRRPGWVSGGLRVGDFTWWQRGPQYRQRM
jgi:hypothetical protein